MAIEEEIAFAQLYFKLIQYKYGNAFQLHIQSINTNGFVVPLTIQSLIENAIKHNLASEANPIIIQINIDQEIIITNNRVARRLQLNESGKALNNLKEQYLLLTNTEIKIIATDTAFSVIIPKIAMPKSV